LVIESRGRRVCCKIGKKECDIIIRVHVHGVKDEMYAKGNRHGLPLMEAASRVELLDLQQRELQPDNVRVRS
jgi:hypothetical protein